MASRPPTSVAGRVSAPGLFRKPMWVPWDHAPEKTDAKGNIIGVGEPLGRIRMVGADTTHTATVKTKMDPSGRPQSAVKGFVPLEYAPDEAKIAWHLMRQRMIANAEAVGQTWEELTTQEPAIVAFAHFAEEGKRLLDEREQGKELAKAGKGAADAA